MPKEILIVDDEPDVVVPIQFLMEQQGYRVMAAERGEDALDLIYHYKPDLVLLDIMLPGIDGYEVCDIVRLNPDFRNVKIMFLTAKGREVDIAKGLALGADAYLTKPFSNAELVAKVKELLEKTDENSGGINSAIL
jgi:DNA-binding response OmpR family regulator